MLYDRNKKQKVRVRKGKGKEKINAMPGGCSVNAALLRIRKNAVAIGDSY